MIPPVLHSIWMGEQLEVPVSNPIHWIHSRNYRKCVAVQTLPGISAIKAPGDSWSQPKQDLRHKVIKI